MMFPKVLHFSSSLLFLFHLLDFPASLSILLLKGLYLTWNFGLTKSEDSSCHSRKHFPTHCFLFVSLITPFGSQNDDLSFVVPLLSPHTSHISHIFHIFHTSSHLLSCVFVPHSFVSQLSHISHSLTSLTLTSHTLTSQLPQSMDSTNPSHPFISSPVPHTLSVMCLSLIHPLRRTDFDRILMIIKCSGNMTHCTRPQWFFSGFLARTNCLDSQPMMSGAIGKLREMWCWGYRRSHSQSANIRCGMRGNSVCPSVSH